MFVSVPSSVAHSDPSTAADDFRDATLGLIPSTYWYVQLTLISDCCKAYDTIILFVEVGTLKSKIKKILHFNFNGQLAINLQRRKKGTTFQPVTSLCVWLFSAIMDSI